MKRACKACWRISFAVLIGALLASLAVTLILESRQHGLHISRAEVMTQQTHGFVRPPYALDAGLPEGRWIESALPRALRAPGVQRSTGRLRSPDETLTQITWYRITVPTPDTASGPHYLYVPRWKSDGSIDVYGDGRQLYQSHINSQWNGSERPLLIALDDFAHTEVPHEIVIRMQHLRDVGGALSSLWIGNDDAIGWRFRIREWLAVQLPLVANSVWIVLGMFSLLVWFLRKREPLYLYFFLISAEAYVHSTHNFAGSQRLPIAEEWYGWLSINAGFWMVATSQLFINYINPKTNPRFTRSVLAVVAACSLLTLPVPGLADAVVVAPLTYLAILLTGISVFSVGFWRFFQARTHAGMLLTTWGLVSIASGVFDWLMRSNLINIEGFFLNPYANVGSFFIFTYVMFDRYIDAHQKVEKINASLEERLQARETELLQSHELLRAAEQRALIGQERQRMTMEMHDGVGSALVSALRGVETGRVDGKQIADVLRTCIDDLKLAIDSMEVADTDLLLLLATVRFRLGPRLESAGIKLRWEVQDVPALSWLTASSALHILRIIQEAFTNIIKHAQATEIRVATVLENDKLLVIVSNNGNSFDAEKALRSGGKGLMNQLRRAELIGGKIQWLRTDSGMQQCLSLPLTANVAPG
jgi:signal transduction histidine kinase